MESLLVVSFQGLEKAWAVHLHLRLAGPAFYLLTDDECIAAGDQPTETTQGMATSESIVSSADSSWYCAIQHGTWCWCPQARNYVRPESFLLPLIHLLQKCCLSSPWLLQKCKELPALRVKAGSGECTGSCSVHSSSFTLLPMPA